jgi:hypothetical protein
MRSVKRSIRNLGLVATFWLLAGSASACPTCRSALAEGGVGWVHGFALSIAVLLGVLFIAAGSFGLAVWRATR